MAGRADARAVGSWLHLVPRPGLESLSGRAMRRRPPIRWFGPVMFGPCSRG